MGYKTKKYDRLWDDLERLNPEVNETITENRTSSSNDDHGGHINIDYQPPSYDSSESIIEEPPSEVNVANILDVEDSRTIPTVTDESLAEDPGACNYNLASTFPDEVSFFNVIQSPQDSFDVFSREAHSFQLMQIIDEAGAPRYLYDSVKTWIKKQMKVGFDPSSDLMSRELLLRKLHTRFSCPDIAVKQISGNDVYRFPFVQM